jgi:RHS repeat-associated protein
MTDSSGVVSLVNAYQPYGESLSSAGEAETSYGFTGEWRDAGGLIHLRVRYYAPSQGRFLSRDAWEGDYVRPLSLNRWGYVEANPVTRTDPSGYITCFPGVVGLGYFSNNPLSENLTAETAIKLCKIQYDKVLGLGMVNAVTPSPIMNTLRCTEKTKWKLPSTVTELYIDWLCERGPEHVFFNGRHSLTHELASSKIIDELRRLFYTSGPQYNHIKKFSFNEAFWATVDALPTYAMRKDISITHILGSFEYSVYSVDNGRVGFAVNNATERSSGSHFIDRFEGFESSIEEWVERFPHLKTETLTNFLGPSYQVISVLQAKTRRQTTGTEGGGRMEQTFSWSERDARLSCLQNLPWPAYLIFLEIDFHPEYAGR